MLSRERWAALCERLGCGTAAGRFDELEAAYAEAHRRYHDARHVGECLGVFDVVRDLCERPDEVELAIWTHDIVYDPRGADNEARSAELAAAWLSGCGADPGVVRRIRSLILATRHAEVPATPDEEIMVDIDLHILGTGAERFDEYEGQIRQEYTWVPGPLFRRRRAQILRGFFEKDPLYRTAACRSRYEAQAKSNLARSLKALGLWHG